MTTQTLIKTMQHKGINIRWSEERKGNKRELNTQGIQIFLYCLLYTLLDVLEIVFGVYFSH